MELQRCVLSNKLTISGMYTKSAVLLKTPLGITRFQSLSCPGEFSRHFHYCDRKHAQKYTGLPSNARLFFFVDIEALDNQSISELLPQYLLLSVNK